MKQKQLEITKGSGQRERGSRSSLRGVTTPIA